MQHMSADAAAAPSAKACGAPPGVSRFPGPIMPSLSHNDPSGVPARPTLRTLAERTGLHISTVSRALRRPADSDETAALVHATALEIGYRRDAIAASLRTGSSGAIGMVAHALTDVVQAIIYEEVDKLAVEHGYDVLVASTRDEPVAQRRRVELLLSRRVDGLIIADAHVDGAYVDWVASLGVPYVLVMRHAGPEHVSITCDDFAGGRLVAEHLIAQGHRKLAMLTGPEYSSASLERAEGFSATLADHGIALPTALIQDGGLFPGSGRIGMERLLAADEEFSAVFCANDFAAFGATTALRSAGLTPGHDVATVGFNDVEAAQALDLSTVRTPQEELGRRAAATLLDVIAGCDGESERLEPALVVRGSSAVPWQGSAAQPASSAVAPG